MKKSTFLQVVSIIAIVSATIGFDAVLNNFAALIATTTQARSIPLMYGDCFLAFLAQMACLAGGICGFIYCSKPEKMDLCFRLGFTWLVTAFLSNITSILLAASGVDYFYLKSAMLLFFIVLSIVLPIIYVSAVFSFKQKKR